MKGTSGSHTPTAHANAIAVPIPGSKPEAVAAAPTAARAASAVERRLMVLRVWLGFRIYKPLARGVFRFGPRSVLKSSGHTRATEAATMVYVAQHTTIPIPRVLDVFAVGDRTFIVMEYVRGCTLTKAWPRLSKSQQTAVADELKGYIAQMRALPPPSPGRVEAVDGTGLFDPRLARLGKPLGPFDCIADFHAHRGHDIIRSLEAYREAWPQFEAIAAKTPTYRTVFTHADIAPRNILVQDGKIVAIIDWECAGWYPEYWEYSRWRDSNWDSGSEWQNKRDELLDVYSEEVAVTEYLASVYTEV